MNFLQPTQPSSSPKQQIQLKNNLLQIPQFSISNLFSSQKQTLIGHALNNLQTHFFKIINLQIPNPFSSSSSSSSSDDDDRSGKKPLTISVRLSENDLSPSEAEIKKRMYGITVYTISNYSEKRCSVLSRNEERDVEYFFFSKSDAEDYMQQFAGRFDLHTLDVPLSNVVGLEGIGAPIRLVPELSQVKNAIEERRKDIATFPDHDVPFSGVPVFQADCLSFKLRSGEYRPAFLRKEDLEKTLVRFQELDPSIKAEIQVAALEDIIQTMKGCPTSKWNDVVFVAPGLTLWTWLRRDYQLL